MTKNVTQMQRTGLYSTDPYDNIGQSIAADAAYRTLSEA